MVGQSEELDEGEELIYENRQNRSRDIIAARVKAAAEKDAAYRAGGGDAKMRQGPQGARRRFGGIITRQSVIDQGSKNLAAKSATSTGTAPARPSNSAVASKTPAAPARPSATPASKPAPAKPVVKQTGDKSKDMSAWAKANPKLAAAKAERDSTRGTSASTNPLMRGMPGKRPAPTSLNKTGAGAKFDPKAPKILNQDVDMFDLVKGHLLDEGFAETEEAAVSIMANMSEGWRTDILEFLGGQKGDGYVGHPRLGIKNPMAKKQTTTNMAPKNTGLAGKMGNRASQLEAAMKKAGMN